MAAAEIFGTCDPAFAGVREAFVEIFRSQGEHGAAVCVMLDGRTAVDLWGGHLDAERTKPWQRDTVVNVWSTTKGLTALCAHILMDRGQLDLDATVARYWPEFAARGKESIPVRYLLSHRAGLAAVRSPITVDDLFDWKRMTSLLSGMEPWWEPGSASGYHAVTFGYLVGEVVRRVTGWSLGTFFRKEVAEPLGIDFRIGFDDTNDSRIAELMMAQDVAGSEASRLLGQSSPVATATLTNPPLSASDANRSAWRVAEIPSANGHGTARAIATIYGLLARGGQLDSVRLCSAETVERMRESQGLGVDLVLGAGLGGGKTEWGLGYLLGGPGAYGPNPRAFGHDGYGGSFGCVDPECRLGIAYVTNMMGTHVKADPRKKALLDAVYASL